MRKHLLPMKDWNVWNVVLAVSYVLQKRQLKQAIGSMRKIAMANRKKKK